MRKKIPKLAKKSAHIVVNKEENHIVIEFPYTVSSQHEARERIIQDACDKLSSYYQGISRTHFETVIRQYVLERPSQYIHPTARYRIIGESIESISQRVPIRQAAEAEFSSYPYNDRQRLINYALTHPELDKDQVLDAVPQSFDSYKRRFVNNIVNARIYRQLFRAIRDFVKMDTEAIYAPDRINIPLRIADTLNHALGQNSLYANIEHATVNDLIGSEFLRENISTIDELSSVVSNIGYLRSTFDRWSTRVDDDRPIFLRNIIIVLNKLCDATKKVIDKTLEQASASVHSGEIYKIHFDEISPENDQFNEHLNRSTSLSQPENIAYDRLIQITHSAEDGADIDSINTGNVDLTDISKEKIVAYARELKKFLEASNDAFDDKITEMLPNSMTFSARMSKNLDLKAKLVKPINDANYMRGAFHRHSVRIRNIEGNHVEDETFWELTNIRNSVENMKRRHPNWQTDAVDVIERLKQELQSNHASNNKTQVALQVLDAFAGNIRDGIRVSTQYTRFRQFERGNVNLKELISLVWHEIKRVPNVQEKRLFIETLIDQLVEIRFAHCDFPNDIVSVQGYRVICAERIIGENSEWGCAKGAIERLIGMFDFSTFHDDIFVHDRSDTLASRAVDWGDFNYQVGQNIDKHIMKLFELMSVNTPTSFVSLDHNEALYRRLAFWRMAKWYNTLTAATNSEIEAMNDLRLRTIVFAEGTQPVIGDLIF